MITAVTMVHDKHIGRSKRVFRSTNRTTIILFCKHVIPLIYCHSIDAHQIPCSSGLGAILFLVSGQNLLAPSLVTGCGGLPSTLLAPSSKTVGHSLFFVKIFMRLANAAHCAGFFHKKVAQRIILAHLLLAGLIGTTSDRRQEETYLRLQKTLLIGLPAKRQAPLLYLSRTSSWTDAAKNLY